MGELSAAAGGFFAGAGAGNPVLEWGIRAIHALQGGRPEVLTFLARAVTELGNPLAYIAIVAFAYWCADERRAFRAGLALFVSNGLNLALKSAIREPRPWVLEPGINLVTEPTFSFPSGHAQNAAAFWPALLAGTRRKGGTESRTAAALILAIPFLVGLSRVYLGAHYPTDVLVGWAIGALAAAVAVIAIPRALAAFKASEIPAIRAIRESFERRIAEEPRTLVTVRLVLAALGAFALNAIGGEDTSMGGALFGFAMGPALHGGEFRAAEGSVAKKGARSAIGLLVLGVLYFGLKALLPGEGTSWYRLARFARYALCGFWATGLAPYLFLKAGLSRSGR